MRALVTGGAGFIGSNLADALLDRGDEVAVVDNLSTGRLENLDGARRRGIGFHEADIADAERLRAIFAGSRPDIVFHLAAQIDVRKSIEDPAWDAGINVGGTIQVLEAARLAGVARVVNTSTGGAIYGEVDTIPTPETTQPRPMAAYGTSKLCAETYCGWYDRLYGLSTVTLRYGNVYGPRQDPLGEAGVIAICCGRLMSGQRPTIFGDGPQTRDYVYGDDLRRRPPDPRLRLRRRHRRREPRRRLASRGARRLQHRHGPRGLGPRSARRPAPRRAGRRGGVQARVRPGATRRAPAQRARRRPRPRRARLQRAGGPRRGPRPHARLGPLRGGRVTMPSQAADLHDFYEQAYTADPDAERHGRWRAMSAVAKADHLVELAGAIGLRSPTLVAEIGCGDGSVLAELGRRGFGGRRIGFELSEAAVRIAAQHDEVDEAAAFDGAHIPAADDTYDLAFATHVLEHVPDPALLLREMMRVARAVVVEVPLERNLSARRSAARAASEAAGHLQRFDRAAVRRLVTDAGWEVRGDIVDPLGIEVHLFGRDSAAAKAKGLAKWAVRRMLSVRPEVGARLFTVHYALVATPARAVRHRAAPART